MLIPPNKLVRLLMLGIAMGASVGTLSLIRLAAEVNPIIASIIGILAFNCAWLTWKTAHEHDRDAIRATELRAALTYAMENGGSMPLFLRLYLAGNRQSLDEFFPTWHAHLADAMRKGGDT